MKRALSFDDVLIIPQRSIVDSRNDIILETQLTRNIFLKIPLVSMCMDTVTEDAMAISMAQLGGLGIIHRFCSIEDQVKMVQKVKQANPTYIVAASVGIKDDYLERAIELEKAGCDLIVIDVANAHSNKCINALKNLKQYVKKDILVGNVATSQGCRDLIEAGADGIKVGIGNGTICKTRIVAGAGISQITAIIDCYEVGRVYNVPIISEGGVKNSGDIVKAIVAGSNATIIGSLFAGTDEAPGKIIEDGDLKYKEYRGMMSEESIKKRATIFGQEKITTAVPEGIKSLVPYRGPVKNVIDNLLGGIRSGLSYCGVVHLRNAVGRQYFVEITNAGLKESHPHSVKIA